MAVDDDRLRLSALMAHINNCIAAATASAPAAPTMALAAVPAGQIWKSYYRAGSQLIAMRVEGDPDSTKNGVFYLHSDHLGSASLTTDGNGSVVSRQLYDAWGNVRTSASTGKMPTDIGYTGQRLDSYIKLVQMGARWYDPDLGRWISPDTIVPDPNRPQQFNRFSYVSNNPLRSRDSTGLCADSDTACIAVVAKIKSLFGIDLIDGSEIWTWATANNIFGGLNEMAQKFAGEDYHIKGLFVGTKFYRDKDAHGNVAETLADHVSFSDIWAGYADDTQRFFMAHELGHVWDSRDTLFHLFRNNKSFDFASAVGAKWDYSDLLHPKYRLGNDFPKQPGRHRDDNEAEDWAESFATVMVPEYDNRNIGNKRETYVKAQISLWVNRNSWQGGGVMGMAGEERSVGFH